jgi:hypothetical protein
MSRFLEEVEEGVVCVLMLCEKGAKGDDDVPLELQEVLSEFDDLMPEDLPLVCRSWDIYNTTLTSCQAQAFQID